MTKTYEQLTEIFEIWCKTNNQPFMCADELLLEQRENLRSDQIFFLEQLIIAWDKI